MPNIQKLFLFVTNNLFEYYCMNYKNYEKNKTEKGDYTV